MSTNCLYLRLRKEKFPLNWDEDDIEDAIAAFRAEKERLDSQLHRFIVFLDDQALARVRQAITLGIMQAIARYSQAKPQSKYQALSEYVNRVSILSTTFTEIDYSVDLTKQFGINAEFDLAEHLRKATFYSCLPVWAECFAQIFEEKVRNLEGTNYDVLREVSYRFRINGNHPEQNKSAFLARLDQIEAELFPGQGVLPQRPERHLAALIVLAIAIPHDLTTRLNQETLPNFVQQLM